MAIFPALQKLTHMDGPLKFVGGVALLCRSSWNYESDKFQGGVAVSQGGNFYRVTLEAAVKPLFRFSIL